jgi:hypothetical protein
MAAYMLVYGTSGPLANLSGTAVTPPQAIAWGGFSLADTKDERGLIMMREAGLAYFWAVGGGLTPET